MCRHDAFWSAEALFSEEKTISLGKKLAQHLQCCILEGSQGCYDA